MSKKLIALITIPLLLFVLFLTSLSHQSIFAQVITTLFGYPHVDWKPVSGCDYGDSPCGATSRDKLYHAGIDSWGSTTTPVPKKSPKPSPIQQPIVAIAPGIVYEIIPNATNCKVTKCPAPKNGCSDHGLGNSVIIEHTLPDQKKVYSLYGHMATFSNQMLDPNIKGTCISKGTQLGIMGGSGYGKPDCWGTHLHLEIKTAGVLGDPLNFLTDSKNYPQGLYFGYTPTDPNLLGYFDPKLFIGPTKVESVIDCTVPTPTPTPTPGWSAAAVMTTPRYAAKAVRLLSGKVLVLGGANSTGNLLSPEIYDPNGNDGAGSWTETKNMNTPRSSAGVVLLSSGKVIVAGGKNSSNTVLKSVEIFDPDNNSWSSAQDMLAERYGAGIALLADGRVLVAGGSGTGDNYYLTSSEIFDPNQNGGAGSWTSTADISMGRGPVLTTLNSSKVLATGGYNWSWGGSVNTSEIFDPNGNGGAGSWTVTENMIDERTEHTATLLANGKVLVIGGKSPHTAPWTAEIFDPDGNAGSGSWTLAPALENSNVLFYENRATLLPNGTVLVIGFNTGSPVPMAKIFDPSANNGIGKWIATADMSTVRIYPTATLLANGKVLVAGGYSSTTVFSSTEIYTP